MISKDQLEKYWSMNLYFVPKAARLDIICKAQRRLLLKIKSKDPDVKLLALQSAEMIEACEDFLKFAKETLNDILKDYQAAYEGAELRNILNSQSELISEFLDKGKQNFKKTNGKIIG